MSTTPFVTSHHPAAGGYQPQDTTIPARRPTRKFSPAPVHVTAPVQVAVAPVVENDQLSVADAVLELLRSVNRNGVRQ